MKILIVDEREERRATLSDALAKAGCVIHWRMLNRTTCTSAEGTEISPSPDYAAVLVHDGLETLCVEDERKEGRIIFYSGSDDLSGGGSGSVSPSLAVWRSRTWSPWWRGCGAVVGIRCR